MRLLAFESPPMGRRLRDLAPADRPTQPALDPAHPSPKRCLPRLFFVLFFCSPPRALRLVVLSLFHPQPPSPWLSLLLSAHPFSCFRYSAFTPFTACFPPASYLLPKTRPRSRPHGAGAGSGFRQRSSTGDSGLFLSPPG